jgi:hypothetical protein
VDLRAGLDAVSRINHFPVPTGNRTPVVQPVILSPAPLTAGSFLKVESYFLNWPRNFPSLWNPKVQYRVYNSP